MLHYCVMHQTYRLTSGLGMPGWTQSHESGSRKASQNLEKGSVSQPWKPIDYFHGKPDELGEDAKDWLSDWLQCRDLWYYIVYHWYIISTQGMRSGQCRLLWPIWGLSPRGGAHTWWVQAGMDWLECNIRSSASIRLTHSHLWLGAKRQWLAAEGIYWQPRGTLRQRQTGSHICSGLKGLPVLWQAAWHVSACHCYSFMTLPPLLIMVSQHAWGCS